ncbi:MAG TPA: DUF308 domain-containing protein [Gemmataceae bacterium]|nr:DUF308 domain-containing protein [Gemmataceae bacterium]
MAELTTAPPQREHSVRRRWFLALGVGLLLLGLAGAGVTTLLELTSLFVFGPLLLASSLMQMLIAFFAEKRKERLLHFSAAGLEGIVGFFLMAHPLLRVVNLIALIAIFLIVGGLIRLARALATQSPGRAWIVVTGAVALLLGISVWLGWPIARLWFVGLCIAIDFLCHGLCWSAVVLAESKPFPESLE